MGLVVNSTNVATFDFEVSYNLNTKAVTITNATTYQGGGAAATSGINFLLTAPDGTEYSDNTTFGASADIPPATPAVPFVADMVTFLGQVISGNWICKGILKDEGVEYPLTKTLNLCKVASCDAQKNTSNGCAVISFTANCVSNQLVYQDRSTYNYKGVDATDVVYSVTMQYPLASGKASIVDADVAYYVDSPVYSGLYQFDIENTATYDFDENQSVVIVYKLVYTKQIYCQVSLCDLKCVFANYIDAYIDEKNNNAQSQKARTMGENMLLLNSYILQAELGLGCGDDISELIAKIEAIAGKVCNCCGNGNTPIGINTLQNIVIEGECGTTVTETTVGSTTTYNINSKTFVVDTSSEGITISVDEDGCETVYYVDACLDSLTLCSSVITVNNAAGGETVIAQGSTLDDVVDAISDSIQTLYTTKVGNPTWNNITDAALQNSFINYVQAAYTSKDQAGWVSFRGRIGKNVPANTVLFYTLPSASLYPAVNASIATYVYDVGSGNFFPAEIGISSTNGQCYLLWNNSGASGQCTLGLETVRFSTVA
jgi:hypothetical protein